MAASTEQFISLPWREAQAHALAQGLSIRDMTQSGFYTDAFLENRVNVWLNDDQVVIRAEIR